MALGHNYIGCEHVLLGLIADEEGMAGKVLRRMGVELRTTRRAVVTALSGFVHAQQRHAPAGPAPAAPDTAAPAAVAGDLTGIRQRLDDIERPPRRLTQQRAAITGRANGLTDCAGGRDVAVAPRGGDQAVRAGNGARRVVGRRSSGPHRRRRRERRRQDHVVPHPARSGAPDVGSRRSTAASRSRTIRSAFGRASGTCPNTSVCLSTRPQRTS